MSKPKQTGDLLGRLEIMERVSHLKREINDMRYRRQRLVSDIKEKRQNATNLKKKRDELNQEVKRLVTQGKEHVRKRDKVQGEVKILEEKRSGITQDIKPKAQNIRSQKEIRKHLNRTAHASVDELKAEFEASLKTLFQMDLALREEVIMVEMVMDVQRRYNARKDANVLSTDIKKTWKDIKGIEEQASAVTFQIMSLASDGQEEHQKAMELFDRKNELSAESQEYHDNFIALSKEIKTLSRDIDVLSRELDDKYKELKPLLRKLDNLRLVRREQQQLEKLKVAKNKMETTGKIGLEDLKVLLESKALDLGKDKKKKGKK